MASCSWRPPSAALRRRRAARDSEPSRGLRGRFIAEWKTQRNPLNSPEARFILHPPFRDIRSRKAGWHISFKRRKGCTKRSSPTGSPCAGSRSPPSRFWPFSAATAIPDSPLCRLPGHHRAHHGGYLQHDVHLPHRRGLDALARRAHLRCLRAHSRDQPHPHARHRRLHHVHDGRQRRGRGSPPASSRASRPASA